MERRVETYVRESVKIIHINILVFEYIKKTIQSSLFLSPFSSLFDKSDLS